MKTTRAISRRDVDFLLYEWLDAAQLPDRDRYAAHDRSTFDGMLDMAEELAAKHFAPINRLLDDDEPRIGRDGTVVQPAELRETLRAYAESGFTAATFDEELGGAQVPFVVRSAAAGFFQASAISAYAYPFLSEGNAHLLAAHGTPEQVRTYALPVIEGRWFGTMCLSEPGAGSSLSDITTTAHPQADGSYRLVGTKMWISGGDHELTENIVHLVLAKTPGAPAGVKGISLFVVPKVLVREDGSLGVRNDVALAGLNHKMGYRGTTNALLSFGEGAWTPGGAPGAVGHLVGEVGEGLTVMFHMMNEARIGVGSGAVALGYAGYLHSLEYARTRLQGRSPRDKAPTSSPVAIVEHPDVRRMLVAQKSYVEGGLALILYCARLVDETRSAPTAHARAEATSMLDVLTPIAKSWPSQWCLRANDLAIQVLGGYGYARDFPLEQFYRDNRLNPIHEGTHGIQGLDLLGRKVTRAGGADLHLLVARMRRSIETARPHGGARGAHAEALARSVEELLRVTSALWDGAEPDEALANASAYLEVFGHVVLAWIWLEQELAAADHEGSFYDGKRLAARYFFDHELPTTAPALAMLSARDRLTLDLDPEAL